jgi:hypothetical protein
MKAQGDMGKKGFINSKENFISIVPVQDVITLTLTPNQRIILRIVV